MSGCGLRLASRARYCWYDHHMCSLRTYLLCSCFSEEHFSRLELTTPTSFRRVPALSSLSSFLILFRCLVAYLSTPPSFFLFLSFIHSPSICIIPSAFILILSECVCVCVCKFVVFSLLTYFWRIHFAHMSIFDTPEFFGICMIVSKDDSFSIHLQSTTIYLRLHDFPSRCVDHPLCWRLFFFFQSIALPSCARSPPH